MMLCPQCRTTYTDDSLRFCLADGAPLIRTDEEETAVRRGVRIGIDDRLPVSHQKGPEQKKKGSRLIGIVLALVALGLLALIVVVGAGLVYYINTSDAGTPAKPSPTPQSAATPSPTLDAEKERLQKELANLQKKLDDEKKSAANRSTPSFPDPNDGRPTARVNSPNDGFLALRDKPNAQTGARLAKIPHGATVYLENCEKGTVAISGRTGRWCMVTYNDETGWVFDAWLTYDQK